MKRSKNPEIPVDVYVQFVRSLFNDANTVLLGAFCHGLIAAMVYLRSGDVVFLALAGLLFGAGLFRFNGMLKFRSSKGITDEASAWRWEREYLLRGGIQGFVLGAFCFSAIYSNPNDYGEIAAVSVALGSTVAIVGRNYGSRVMVMILSTTVVLPISAALLLKGDFYHFVLGLFIIPFFFILIKMANHVRTVLFSAISEQKYSKRIAHQFDKALNTMSHGLIMLGKDGRVVVANAEAVKLLNAASAEQLHGRTLRALLMRCVAAGIIRRSDHQSIEKMLTGALKEGRDRKMLVEFANNRHFEFSAREGRDELGVITFEDVTGRIEAEEKIRYMARYDSLTGLPNRAYFCEIVNRVLAGQPADNLCALAVLDLDDFKHINDTHGHPVGDGLIYAIGERLSKHVDDNVKVSRFGGDEFMVFVRNLPDEAAMCAKLEMIFDDLAADVDVAGHVMQIQASAGAVVCRVADADVDGMIVKADLALYATKDSGKNHWKLFEASMDEAFRRKQTVKSELRQAISRGQLRVAYQPIVGMKSMKVEACESLCRWDHPDLGAVSPAEFIPLAEEMGIVTDITEFMLERACLECMSWPENTRVSVNLSANDFRNPNIVKMVCAALENSGLAAERLEIEVTETAVLDDRSRTRDYLNNLKALGVSIALDDFGTGYSSLSYLHDLPLDKLKIDRAFVMDITENKRSLDLLKGVLHLSRQLGLKVTIEGVETFEQLKVLSGTKISPDLLQGFLFGAPLSASGVAIMTRAVQPFGKELQETRQSPVRKSAVRKIAQA